MRPGVYAATSHHGGRFPTYRKLIPASLLMVDTGSLLAFRSWELTFLIQFDSSMATIQMPALMVYSAAVSDEGRELGPAKEGHD